MEHTRIHLTKESETLFIPLYGRAQVCRYGDILRDGKAAEIVSKVDYDFSRNESSRYLSIYMGIRAAILDGFAEDFLARNPDAMVLHLGCGLDARAMRISRRAKLWVDVDLPPVIEARREFYEETESYHMLPCSVTEPEWVESLPYRGEPVLVIAEGLTMYLTDEENKALFLAFSRTFRQTDYVFDAHSLSAVRWSKRKNPVNRMGARIRWGLDEPSKMENAAPGVRHTATRYFTERQWVDKLSGGTKLMFRLLYGNRWANSLYRIYYFEIRPERS